MQWWRSDQHPAIANRACWRRDNIKLQQQKEACDSACRYPVSSIPGVLHCGRAGAIFALVADYSRHYFLTSWRMAFIHHAMHERPPLCFVFVALPWTVGASPSQLICCYGLTTRTNVESFAPMFTTHGHCFWIASSVEVDILDLLNSVTRSWWVASVTPSPRRLDYRSLGPWIPLPGRTPVDYNPMQTHANSTYAAHAAFGRQRRIRCVSGRTRTCQKTASLGPIPRRITEESVTPRIAYLASCPNFAVI